jgi:hypothetical protein
MAFQTNVSKLITLTDYPRGYTLICVMECLSRWERLGSVEQIAGMALTDESLRKRIVTAAENLDRSALSAKV